MKRLHKHVFGTLAFVAGALMACTAGATTCVGNCGTDGADGVVTLPPNGASSYQWISTDDGIDGVGGLPGGALGDETNGSTLATTQFSATSGTLLDFYFNYATSDGTGYADYAWAGLFDSSDNLVSLLFTARTKPSGSIVPGQGMPPVNAALTPSPVLIIGGAPIWSPLGGDSGSCWNTGCGYTGWINADYTIATAGDYYLKIGVTNWDDEYYNSGLAMAGVTVGGVPVPTGVPEPASLGMFGLGVLLSGLLVGLRRRRAFRLGQL